MEIGNDFLQAAIEHSGKPLRTGGNTFYMRDGKLCIQASRRPASSGKNWVQTPARERCNRHFAAMRAVATYLKGVYEGLPVWQLAKKRQGWRMTVENFLMRVMRPYFDERGEMVRCEGALMSVGDLVPGGLGAAAGAGGGVCGGEVEPAVGGGGGCAGRQPDGPAGGGVCAGVAAGACGACAAGGGGARGRRGGVRAGVGSGRPAACVPVFRGGGLVGFLAQRLSLRGGACRAVGRKSES